MNMMKDSGCYQNQDELLPMAIMLMFSVIHHSEETRNFIDLFRPKLVYPCTESRVTWLNGFTVSRVFGDLCVGNPIIGLISISLRSLDIHYHKSWIERLHPSIDGHFHNAYMK